MRAIHCTENCVKEFGLPSFFIVCIDNFVLREFDLAVCVLRKSKGGSLAVDTYLQRGSATPPPPPPTHTHTSRGLCTLAGRINVNTPVGSAS